MLEHTGAQAGFNSVISYLPALGHGMYVVMNRMPTGNIRALLVMYLYDLLLGNTLNIINLSNLKHLIS